LGGCSHSKFGIQQLSSAPSSPILCVYLLYKLFFGVSIFKTFAPKLDSNDFLCASTYVFYIFSLISTLFIDGLFLVRNTLCPILSHPFIDFTSGYGVGGFGVEGFEA